ncbi:hypothetical protein MOK15_01560 [Sphingobium sp. BYY-5]|uniref:hypothetical protein n=1 Tax=Sphingobium sp. BYY-5 TaxID=2926400 RepID=UPI001FA78C75|nr:hypothetical protein [Sphingobium sp. BYY-5]MCI4588796.1 hypothetical protein [Sphingobium sp. BYY-5]
MIVGATPSSISDPSTYIREVFVKNIQLRHSTPVTPPASGNEYNAPAGLRTRYVYECEVRNVAGWECSIGFAIYGNVSSRYVDCFAFRSSAGSSSINDIWRGFWLKGNPPVLAGGNASVHLVRCKASQGGTPALVDPVGFKLDGAFVDSFLSWCETSQIPVGIHVTGTGAAGTLSSNLDLHISHPIIDQASNIGIHIEQLAPSALVEIAHPYVACAASAFAALYIHDGGGRISIVGGQAIGSGGTTLGFYAVRQSGTNVAGLKLLNMARPVGVDSCSSFRINPDIVNPDIIANPYQAAIRVDNSSRMVLQPALSGRTNAFPQGIYLVGASNNYMEIDPTLIEPSCISGGAGNKVQINGIPITSLGSTGTHYITGVLA